MPRKRLRRTTLNSISLEVPFYRLISLDVAISANSANLPQKTNPRIPDILSKLRKTLEIAQEALTVVGLRAPQLFNFFPVG